MFFDALINETEESGLPKIGLKLLMGESTKAKLFNLLNALKEGGLILQSGMWKKE